MKRLMLVLSVLFGQVLFAEVLQTITITPENIELKEGTSLPLHATGHYDTGVEKDITSKVEWSVTDTQSVTIDANATLQALKEGTTTITAKLGSVESSSEVTVYWEVDGHRLPPEPDPAVNNATLLGIDVNNNGVRDDVERYIYKRFGKAPEYPKTKIALAMQYAWAIEKILENPIIESMKHLEDAAACESYWVNKKTEGWLFEDHIKFRLSHRVFNDTKLKDVMLNTKERILQKFKFNEACSGNIFNGSPKTIDSCQKNIDSIKE